MFKPIFCKVIEVCSELLTKCTTFVSSLPILLYLVEKELGEVGLVSGLVDGVTLHKSVCHPPEFFVV